MQHTLVAVFDNRSDAQKALEDLVSSGFSRQEARLSEGDPTGQSSLSSTTDQSNMGTAASHSSDTGIGSKISNFFSDIFGTDRSTDAQMYSDAVTRGHYVLTLTASSEPEVERAADIVERYGPVDIDEKSQNWGATGMATAGAMGEAGGMQQSQAMSQQYAAGTDPTFQGAGSTMGSGSTHQESDPTLQATGSSMLDSGSSSMGSGSSLGTGSTMTGGSSSLQGGMQNSQLEGTPQRVGDTQAIPVIQEELKVGKREVQRGGVRIFQRVVETPFNETVGLREERVNVERHAVDRPVSAADVNAFQETTIELREMAEEAVVSKTARVVEEVVVGKEVNQRQEQITDTVRRTEVEVQQLSPQDETYFRNHFTSNYASAGGTYEDYAPAYSYGTSMRGSDTYRNRKWDEAEPSLRSDWESRNPGSAWEKTKAAVRHGWDKVTS